MKKFLSLSLLMMLTGCSLFNSDTPNVDLGVSEIPVKIGVITPLSGGLATYGVETKNIIDATLRKEFADDQNIEIVYEDSKCSGSDAVTAYQKLVNIDKVDVILGGLCSTESLAFAPLLEADSMVALSNVSTSPDLEGLSTNFMTLSFNDEDLARNIAKEADFSDKVAIITEQNDWNTGILKVLEKDLGDKIISNETFEKGSNDFRSIITKTLNANPEVIILNPNAGPTSTDLINQLAEYKDQLDGVTLVSQILLYLTDGVIESSDGVSGDIRVVDTATLQTQEFKDFKADSGEIIFYTDFFVASTHDALVNLVNSYREAVSSETSMVEVLRNAKLKGFVSEDKTFGESSFLKGVDFSTFVYEDGEMKEL